MSTKLDSKTFQALGDQCYHIIENAYQDGVDDGESAYMAYDFYGESSLAPNFVNQFKVILNQKCYQLPHGQQNQLIDELIELTETYYEHGVDDGTSAYQDYNFAGDYDDEVTGKLEALLKQYFNTERI